MVFVIDCLDRLNYNFIGGEIGLEKWSVGDIRVIIYVEIEIIKF